MSEKLYAVIEVGSHTTWLLVVKKDANGIEPLLQKQKACRLANEKSEISQKALIHLSEIFLSYRQTIHNVGAELQEIVFTEAVRKAINQQEVLERVQKVFHKNGRVLSGEEEAEASWNSVRFRYQMDDLVLVDIGGGSTEIASFSEKKSYSLGVLELSDRFGAVPGADLHGYVQTFLEDQNLESFQNKQVVFTGGTAILLGMQIQNLEFLDVNSVEGCEVNLHSIEKVKARLSEMSREIRNQLPGMDDGRGNLFLPGLEVIQCFLEILKPTHSFLSSLGVRFGILWEKLVV